MKQHPEITDAANITVTYVYDALNRMTDIHFPDSSQDISCGYDSGTYGIGRLTSVGDPPGSTAFAYNALGQITQETRTAAGLTFETVYGYDAVTADLNTLTYPTGTVLTYQRDADGRISGISADGQTIIGNVTYQPFGPVSAMTMGNLPVTRTFDQRYQVSGIAAGTVMNRTYTHDGAGNVKSISGITKPPVASGTTDYSIPSGSSRLSGSTGKTAKTYTYDNAGKITSDGVRTFTYNQNGQLIRVTAGASVIAEYAYDGFSRRVKKTAEGRTVLYHYDYDGNLISETDGEGSPLRDYVYLYGQPVAMKLYGEQAGWYYFLNDHLGTPQKVVNASGAVVWEAGYMPFGEARVLVADVVNNLRFPSQYFDAETGLHYNWHRYYDPDTGRYLTPAPIGLEGGMNLYAYVDGNPVNWVDPYGLIAGVDDLAVIALIGASAATMAYISSPEGQRALNQMADNIWSMMSSGGDSGGGTCNISGESTPGMPNDPDDDPEIKNVYNSVKNSPRYPKNFTPDKGNTLVNNIKDKELLAKLRQIEPGKWQKVYNNGWANGERVSIHFFRSESGKVFDVKTVQGWSLRIK
ncbi:MAG: RHS repeat-associated core domain-containing protein [Desulfobacterales bacterium]